MRSDRSEVIKREREFFDAQAQDLDIERMPPREYAPYESRFEDALIERCADLRGKSVLDLGCGTGDLTLRLLKRGARVTALDLSPKAIEVAQGRARLFVPGADARFITAPAEETGFPNASFDYVLGKFVLHHLPLQPTAMEVARILKPGGVGVFAETSALNPLLRFARRALPGRFGIARYGTEDEQPLSRSDVRLFSSFFESAEVDFPVMVLAFLVERHILKWRIGGTDRILNAADRLLGRFGSLGRLSYYLRLTVHGATPASAASR